MPIDTPSSRPHNRDRLARAVFITGLSFFLIAALLGIFLRLQALEPIAAVNYRHFLHAHSHAAFLAWVFNALLAVSIQHFATEDQLPAFRKVFYLLQIANLGMLASFPFQGYAFWSISFSTLHMTTTFAFAWKLFRKNALPPLGRQYLRTALVFMAISSVGPLALGPLGALELRDSPWYTLSIYFYMHFQYNGWFVFFLLASVIALSHSKKLESAFAAAYPFLTAGCLLSLAQAAIWANFSYLVNLASLLGSILQLIGCGIIFSRIQNLDAGFIARLPYLQRQLLRVALACLILKFVFQFAGSLPGLDVLASHRSAAIGFLHLVFLGVVTPALIAWGISNNWIRNSKTTVTASALYLLSFAIGEAVLFYVPAATLTQWPHLPHTPEILTAAAALTGLSIAALLTQARFNLERAVECG
ncbi:hypothetical protein [Pelagicoccus sp. SDUM812005]|uniref:hypothetical protein n=1 Tax=Pelagicoccus sp. SDUM812005 TaxID=3041257 RepID=UPI00280E6402|nr:hypothetical protein [Pelagicoccus sp. SDUM812005]MDQ8182244.1 hypothetical protein [Pelagicoccus sp. SDUM812005]